MRFVGVFFLSFFSFACSSQMLSNSQKDSIINRIKKIISEKYVVIDKIKLIADSIQSSNYLQIRTSDSLIKKLNNDLFYFSHDKHLLVENNPALAIKLLSHSDSRTEQNKKEKEEHCGCEKVKILDGNIGYLKLRYLADAKKCTKKVLKSIHFFKNTKALIIDLRNNEGGSGSMVQLLASVFLTGDDIELLKISYRSGETITIKSQKIRSKFQYSQQPIYILCNSKTYSAGEAFLFVLKNRSRAIVVGETTAGAGNIARPYPINNKFVITVPVGPIVDPLTNTGWEQIGVTADINLNPTDAFDKALELIRAEKQKPSR